MKQAAKEAFKSNMHHHETIKAIAKAYLCNCESSVQEPFYIFARIKAQENLSGCEFY